MGFYLWRIHKGTLKEEHAIHFWGQNLNDKRGGLQGSMWRHGRCWLRFLDNCLNLEWAFFWDSSTAIGFTVGAEDDIKLHLAIWRLFSIHLSLDTVIPRKWRKNIKWWDKSWGRTTDIRIFDGQIWFNIHNDTMGWSDAKRWQEFNWSFENFFLGKERHSKEVLDKGETQIAFLEGTYNVKWEKQLHQWRRARWFTQRVIRYNLDMDENPIPVPGKGENSYDCGDDAIHSIHTPATNLSEALSKLTESVLRTRERYGWSD